MYQGLALIGAFIAGGLCTFALSEHYFDRIAKILSLDESDRVDRRTVKTDRRP